MSWHIVVEDTSDAWVTKNSWSLQFGFKVARSYGVFSASPLAEEGSYQLYAETFYGSAAYSIEYVQAGAENAGSVSLRIDEGLICSRLLMKYSWFIPN